MNIIKPSYEILTKLNQDNPLKFLELCGRVAYKSEDDITDDSCIKFVKMIKTRKHKSVTEHANYIFDCDSSLYHEIRLCIDRSYLRMTDSGLVSGNARAWEEFLLNNPGTADGISYYLKQDQPLLFSELPDVKNVADYRHVTDFSELSTEDLIEHTTQSVRFICNRGFSHELVRHRPIAITQESTRFVNYTKGKHGNAIAVIMPSWANYDWETNTCSIEKQERFSNWYHSMENDEKSYFFDIENGGKPQEARGVLPIDLKTELIITANLREWKHIFSLRDAPSAHPSMQELMGPLHKEFASMLPEVFGAEK